MRTIITYVGISLFLCSACIVLQIVVRVSAKAMQVCNNVWLTYKDTGQPDTTFIESYIEECKSLKEYMICFGKTIPGFLVVCLCHLYLARIPRWFYRLDEGLAFIAQIDNHWLFRNAVVWGVRLLFLFAFIIPMLKEDCRAMAFPFSCWKDLQGSQSPKDLRVSRGIVFFVLWMNAIILLPVFFGYDAMVGRWGC